MLRKMNVIILTTVLTLSMGLIANAETGGAGNTGGQGNNNMFRTTAANDGIDWGWLGLLGLAGLAGLAGRNRNRNPER